MVRYLKLKILLVRLRWRVAKNQKNNFASIVNFMYVWGAGGAPESAHGGVDVIMWEKEFGNEKSRLAGVWGACSTGGSVFAHTLILILLEPFCVSTVLLC